MLEALLSTAGYTLKLYEEAPNDKARQLRLLKREYAFELLELDDSPEQAQRISTLESMLESRGEKVPDLRGLIATGVDVAPTPVTTRSAPIRPQGSGPGQAPAAPAGIQTGIPVYNIHGTGMITPTAPGVDSQLAALEERLRLQEAEIAAQKLHAAVSSPIPAQLA